MKRYIYIVTFALFMQSCWVDDIAETEQAKRDKTLQALEPYTDYTVVADGTRATILTWGDDTIAATRQTMKVKVPKTALTNGELKTTYSADDIFAKFGQSSYWYYVGFEDTRNGDYDYNDIVLHARAIFTKAYDNSWAKAAIAIQPIALGSISSIKIGILYNDSDKGTVKEKILVQNARAELFGGLETFPINTDRNKEITQLPKQLITFAEIELDKDITLFKVVWFIEAGGNRFYAVTTNFSGVDMGMLDKSGIPYGLSMTKTWDYPTETTNIKECYPNFESWLTNGNEAELLGTRDSSKCFPAGTNKLWDWER